ncbi:unnamed protein product [Symbiodinium necroappetens]|uniref:NACHT domain-containing protein n=1 Tax=Symbiodinium necroappetens TaxID=1628268 RepID=A0A813BTZ1_9DINO|nr:unnamed protein product [Symbiodinium necroappetens]
MLRRSRRSVFSANFFVGLQRPRGRPRFDESCSTLEWHGGVEPFKQVGQRSVLCADAWGSSLRRIWCIFEIWRCCKLDLRLDLFTAEGQLTRRSSTPLACKIREQATVLDLSNTKCSEKSDKLMIEKAVKTSGTTWAQISGVIQLQIASLVEFAASLAISRNALTGEVLSAEDVEMQMSETSEVRNSSSIISDCMQGQLQRILVVGQGGTGKSVFAREVVRRVAQAQFSCGVQEAVIPLRVPLAELADIKDRPTLRLQAWAGRAFGSDSDEILRGDRRLVLVLDGLDEAAIARRRILDWLRQWLQANGHRCICTIIASRPSGTNQVLASDGSAREPAASVVLCQFSETSLLTQEPLPVSSHVRLHGTGQSLGAGTVLSCDKGFLLLKKEENGPEPGVHSLKVRRKGPESVFSDVVSLDYADCLAARVILEPAFVTAGGDPEKQRHRVVAHRADGEVWEDRSPIYYGRMLEWPRGAFPCRAFLKTDEKAADDRKVEDVEVSFRETSAGIFLEGDLEPGDEVGLGSDGPRRELLPLDRCFRVVLDAEVPRCPASLAELGFAPLEILPLCPPVASRISKFGEEELRALPEAVWQTPLMASILGTYPRGQKEEELDGATAELVLMEHAVETLLKQAEERAGCKELRAELGPLCLAKLQAGQRLLLESDFTSQVVFQEAQLGHLRFFEPAGQAVQLYHLRMQEFLAAEARLASAQAPSWREAFAEAQQQPMLRGALRFCLMMQTAHAAEAEIDLKETKLVAADTEAFQGALLCTEKLALNLDENHLGPEGASSLSSALPKRLRQLQLDLKENSIGRGSQRGSSNGQEGCSRRARA